MSRLLRIIVLFAVLASGTLMAAPAGAEDVPIVPGECANGVLPGNALSLICVPTSGWNGGLIVFAHGYVAPGEPLGFYNLDEFPDGPSLPDLVQSLGYAFATTSYRRNGLAIREGVEDVQNLVAAFKTKYPGFAGPAYITGTSEGGAVAALLAEQSPPLFDAGLSLCGPIGDFRKQIDYWGDFRVLFDYFFPSVLLPVGGDAMHIPAELIAGWEDVYQPKVLAALQTNPLAASQLISTSKAAVKLGDPTSIGQTTRGLLWYNVFATEDGKEQLRGNPFDNRTRIYRGSWNDWRLNRLVQRFTAGQAALDAMAPYNTLGEPRIPLITLHTTRDEIVPFWHQTLYRMKLLANGSTGVVQIPILRYGHCNFTTNEVLVAFSLMVLGATSQQMYVPPQYSIDAAHAEMEKAAQDFVMEK